MYTDELDADDAGEIVGVEVIEQRVRATVAGASVEPEFPPQSPPHGRLPFLMVHALLGARRSGAAVAHDFSVRIQALLGAAAGLPTASPGRATISTTRASAVRIVAIARLDDGFLQPADVPQEAAGQPGRRSGDDGLSSASTRARTLDSVQCTRGTPGIWSQILWSS